MTDRIYNISIAGCSRVAHLHAKAIQSIPNACLAGVWSRTAKKAEDFASLYKTLTYSNVTKMVTDNRTDLLIVCNNPPFHVQPAIEAAKAGINVLIEKPLSSSLQDCDDIIKACKKYKVKLGVISQRRWYEPVKRVKDAIVTGKIGRPVLATVTLLGWRDKAYFDSEIWKGKWETEGGGVLANQAPHQLDILLWFMGDIDEVYGVCRNLNHPYIEVEDTAVAIVKFKSGAIGNIIVSNSQNPGIYGNVQVHGENGASVGVRTDGGAMFLPGRSVIAEPPVNDLWTIPGEEIMLKEWIKQDTDTFSNGDPTVQYFQYQIEDYLSALENNSEPSVTGEDGRRVVELFTAIYRSSSENVPVKFPLNGNR